MEKYFQIKWNDEFYSVPTVLNINHNAVIITSNPSKSNYIITPNEVDVIVFKDSVFFDLDNNSVDSEKVKELIKDYSC